MKKNYHNLKKLENIVKFGFFTSNGGVSSGNYFSLNCNKSSKDKKTNVKKNINIALSNLGINNCKLKLINQTHSNKVSIIDFKNYKKKLYGDAMITTEKNIALGVLTADCAPILLFDKKRNFISCIHAGWKGSLSNIVGKTINIIKNMNSSKIIAIVGPCISFNNFEVEKDFKIKFIKKNPKYSKFFKTKNKTKDLFNLRGIINYQIKNEKISIIYNINRDTYKNRSNFFSHRRATHEKKISTGRMINIISLCD